MSWLGLGTMSTGLLFGLMPSQVLLEVSHRHVIGSLLGRGGLPTDGSLTRGLRLAWRFFNLGDTLFPWGLFFHNFLDNFTHLIVLLGRKRLCSLALFLLLSNFRNRILFLRCDSLCPSLHCIDILHAYKVMFG